MNRNLHKINKFLLAGFITALIWVWADLALEQQIEGVPIKVLVPEGANPEIWVTLNGRSQVEARAVLTGPSVQIAQIRRALNSADPELPFTFAFDARQLDLVPQLEREFNLLQFLRDREEIQKLGLEIVEVQPATITVSIVRLEEKNLNVRLLDVNGMPISEASVEPEQVTMLVPHNWTGDQLVAHVRLTADSQLLARRDPIERRPYVELAPGVRRDADRMVRIKLGTQTLAQRAIAPILGYTFGATTQGRFSVELENPAAAMAGFSFTANDAAAEAYAAMPYHLVLMIEERDRLVTGFITRRLQYNFPVDFVERGEIRPVAPAPEVRFRLVPIEAVQPLTPP